MAAKKKLTWKDLISDKETYGDDFVVTTKDGDHTFTLGDLREMNESSSGALAQQLDEREQELAEREQTINRAQNGLASKVRQAADALGMSVDDFLAGKFPKGKKSAKTASSEGDGGHAEGDEDEFNFDELAADPVLSPIASSLRKIGKRIESLQEGPQTKKVQDQVNALTQTVGTMLKAYLDDYAEQSYSSLRTEFKDVLKDDFWKKNSLQQLTEYCEKNGIKDRVGRYNFRKAIKEIAEPQIQEAQRAQWKAEGAKEAEDRLRLASVPRPNSAGPRTLDKTHLNKAGKPKNLDEAWNDAMNDDEILQTLTGSVAGSAGGL